MRRLLVTGAAGRIGKVVCKPLAASWEVRCGYSNPAGREMIEAQGLTAVPCDVTSRDQVDEAVRGVDAVLHLAAISVEAEPESIAKVNILGTTYVLDAAREHGVKRFVYASSNHAIGGHERFSDQLPPKQQFDENTTVWADSHYGASKVHGEALTRWYVYRPGSQMTAACLRIGTTGFQNIDEIMQNERIWSTWMSDRDLIQLCEKSLASTAKYGIYGGVSRNTRRFISIDSAQRDLGYEPQDNAEEFAKARGYESKGYHFAGWQE
jgi:UDP-glucose 4-epimerase